MRTATKIWLIIAAFLVVIGLIMLATAMTEYRWDFTKLNTVKYQTNTYEISEKIRNISLVTDTANVTLIHSDDEMGKVICYEEENSKHSVETTNDTLSIEIADTKKWYQHIGINFGTPEIKIYIPRGEYGKLSIKSSTGDVEIPKDFMFDSIDICGSTGNVKNYASASKLIKIKTSTGDIYVENISAGAIDLSVSTGKVSISDVNCQGEFSVKVSTGKTYMTDVVCKNLTSRGNTGDLFLTKVTAEEKFFIERSTGDVNFNKCDVGEIFVKTDTGDVGGTLLSDKVFIAKTDTGDVELPKTISGGKCEINTNTGDIKISIQK